MSTFNSTIGCRDSTIGSILSDMRGKSQQRLGLIAFDPLNWHILAVSIRKTKISCFPKIPLMSAFWRWSKIDHFSTVVHPSYLPKTALLQNLNPLLQNLRISRISIVEISTITYLAEVLVVSGVEIVRLCWISASYKVRSVFLCLNTLILRRGYRSA